MPVNDDHATILVVDDEREIADLVALYLENEGHEVIVRYDARTALQVVDDPSIRLDMAILDVMLPDVNGFQVCRAIRTAHRFPVIMLTARDREVDTIAGLNFGADDYVTKPFSLEVLGSRVRAHLARDQRSADAPASVRFTGALAVDYAARTVEVAATGARVDLTRIEFDILALLTASPGRVFDRDLIYERVWGWDAEGDPSVVREHVRRVRSKLSAAGADGGCLETVWGVGYRWAGR